MFGLIRNILWLSPTCQRFKIRGETIINSLLSCCWSDSVDVTVLHSSKERHAGPAFLGDGWSHRGTRRSHVRNIRIKGEAGHRQYPTDTKAYKRLLLSAGDKPMPQGNSRIKRSPELPIGQSGLSKVCTMKHAALLGINSGVKRL